MIYINLILIPISVFLMSIVGNAIIKKNFFYNFAIGWLFTSLVLAFTAYFIPNYSRELVIIIIALSFLVIREEQIKYIKHTLNYFNSNYKIIILFFVFSYILFFDKSIFLVTIIYNKLLHHGLAFEILTADYFGNIKFPHHYPVELGPFHLLSNSTLAVLNIFSINPNLHLLMETKLIVTCIIFSSFIFAINKRINNPFKIFLVTVAIYLFFYSEIKLNYDIGSNYLFFIFAIITIYIFHDDALSLDQKMYLMLIFLIIQFHSKAPIGYIFIPVGFYIFIKNLHSTKKISFWLVSLLSLIVVANIFLMPKGNGWLKAQTEYKLSFTSKTGIVSYVKFEPPFFEGSIEKRLINKINNLYLDSDFYNAFTDVVTKYAGSEGGKVEASIFTSKVVYSFLIVLFFLLKFYVPLFYINHIPNYNIFKKEFNILLITSILGWFFVRNSSGYNLSHQSYVYFYISLYSFTYILYYFLNKKISYKFILFFLIYGIFNFALTSEKNLSFKNSYYQNVKKEKNLFNKKLENCEDKKFERFIPDYTTLTSLAMSYGVRMYCVQKKQKFQYDEYYLHKSKKQNQ